MAGIADIFWIEMDEKNTDDGGDDEHSGSQEQDPFFPGFRITTPLMIAA